MKKNDDSDLIAFENGVNNLLTAMENDLCWRVTFLLHTIDVAQSIASLYARENYRRRP